jgi:hypothetical protein
MNFTETIPAPRFSRAGRFLDRDEAVRFVIRGCAVKVAVADEDWMGMSDLAVTVTAGTSPAADPCAHASLPAATGLGAGDLEVYAAVMTAAASLCDAANTAMASYYETGDQAS